MSSDPSDCDHNGCSGMTIDAREVLQKTIESFSVFLKGIMADTKQSVTDMGELRNLETNHDDSHALGLQMMVTTLLFGQISTMLTENSMPIILKTVKEIGLTAEKWGGKNNGV